MRWAYFVEILRARIVLVALSLIVSGLLRSSLSSAHEGEWVASEGQGLAAILAYGLVLPVIAFIAARVEGELGSAAWLLGRPLSRRSIAGLRLAGDAIVIALAAVSARLVIGEAHDDSVRLVSEEINLLIHVVRAWWASPFDATIAMLDRPWVTNGGWSPVSMLSWALVASVYGLGLVSAGPPRQARMRALGLAAVLVAFVAFPPCFVVFLSRTALLSWTHAARSVVFEAGAGETGAAAWTVAAAAWIALAPVIAVAISVLCGIADVEARPRGAPIRRLLFALSGATLLGAVAVSALLAHKIKDMPPVLRAGSSRLVIHFQDSAGEPLPERSSVTAWLQTPGEWHSVHPWVLGQVPLGRAVRWWPQAIRWIGLRPRERPHDERHVSALAAGTYEICAHVDPPMQHPAMNAHACWNREARARGIVPTCVQVVIEDDTDHGTLEVRLPVPEWDGTCPPDPHPAQR